MSALRGLHRLVPHHLPVAAQLLDLRCFSAGTCPVALHSRHLGSPQHCSKVQGWLRPHQRQQRWAATPASASSSEAGFKLVLYSKQDCPLCHKLKEKLGALMDRAAFVPSVLSGVELEVRDIRSSAAWEAAYTMSVPVLATANPDGSGERELPRPSPRLTADGLEKHLQKVLRPTPPEAQ